MKIKSIIFVLFLHQGLLVSSQELAIEEEGVESDAESLRLLEDLGDEFTEIETNQAGASLFLSAIEKSIDDGKFQVKIPKEIDPQERIIPIDDALNKIEDFVNTETTTAQNFVSKIEDVFFQMNATLDETAEFEDMLDTIDTIIQEYNEIAAGILDLKVSVSINQQYEDLYGDDETPYPSIKDTYPDGSKIAYGQDAHHEGKNTSEKKSIAYGDKEASKKKTAAVNTAGSIHLPVFACVAIVMSIWVFLLIVVVTCLCVNRRTKRANKSTPTLAEETKKGNISIITIPVGKRKIPKYVSSHDDGLPSYLEVISDKM